VVVHGYRPSSQLEDDLPLARETLAAEGFDVSEWRTQRIDIELSRDQARWIAQEQNCPEDDFVDPCGRALSFRATDPQGNGTEITVPLAPATER
jgi:hypothetical protein